MADRGGKIILEGSEKTAFRYRIDGGMDERDKDEIEAMDSGYVLGRYWPSIVSDSVDLRHRMGYIRNRNLGFSFIGVPDDEFDDELYSLDENLAVTLAYMVADFYRNGTQRVSDLVENVTRKNPAGLKNVLEPAPYTCMIERYLRSLCGDEEISNLSDNCFFDRIPADRFGCASIVGDKRNGYFTSLILQIVLKA